MSVLTEDAIRKRLFDKRDLVITPILDIEQISDGSVDIRLGTKFIDTKIREFTELNPPDLSVDKIKEFQERIDKVFGSTYILHPRRLILATTFEFISLPEDLSGFVLSRSRYGRAGLMVATATYIHPLWRGCLTLELFNYGDFPIKLYCGSKVAQLVLIKAEALLKEEKRKSITVGPEFTQMDYDDEWEKIEEIGRFWKQQ